MKQSALAGMDIEEKILLTAVCITIVGLFLPWTSGLWLGSADDVGSSFKLFTTTNALLILIGNLLLLGTLFPFISVKVLSSDAMAKIDTIRLIISSICLLLIITMSTFIYEMSNHISELNTGFGMYIALLSVTVSVMYSYIVKTGHDKDKTKPNFIHPNDNPSSPNFTPLH